MAVTSSRCGGVWFSSSFNANAIAKHDECAAAANSSGLVFPPGRSVREVQLNRRPSSAPLLPADSLPSPDARGPPHVVCVLRSAMLILIDPFPGTHPGYFLQV